MNQLPEPFFACFRFFSFVKLIEKVTKKRELKKEGSFESEQREMKETKERERCFVIQQISFLPLGFLQLHLAF